MRRLFKVLIGLALLVAALVTLAAITLKPYRVPSESMEPNVHIGARILVWQLGYSPHVGDIAVFRAPQGADEGQCPAAHPQRAMCIAAADGLSQEKFIKRIVAGPGDRVSMTAGRITRNGRPEKGYRLKPCTPGGACSFPAEVTVPAGHWLVLGDNRGVSDDSRFWGTVPTKAFIGKRLITYSNG